MALSSNAEVNSVEAVKLFFGPYRMNIGAAGESLAKMAVRNSGNTPMRKRITELLRILPKSYFPC